MSLISSDRGKVIFYNQYGSGVHLALKWVPGNFQYFLRIIWEGQVMKKTAHPISYIVA